MQERRGLTFQAGDRAHLGHFKYFCRAGMQNERHKLIDEICRRKYSKSQGQKFGFYPEGNG